MTPPKSLTAFAQVLTAWGLPTFVEKPITIGNRVAQWSLTVGPTWHKTRLVRYRPMSGRLEFLGVTLSAKGAGILSALRGALRTPEFGQYLRVLRKLALLQQKDFGRHEAH